ncbi:endonuclease/exonuclease/phosphatase family protein [Streptomyces ficellus]|uniref:Endonuclease/exonuclease/phosphatase family protein n=2 Tax=Streptomyces ficellus TaxID=1977088 RepID=A0A6I6FGH2_9ACTN|nr:endonuclease/exonuclease/phosphatase family protein [Streptomyces ficellus]
MLGKGGGTTGTPVARGRSPWRRGRVTAALAVVTAALLAFPGAVPNTPGRLGSLLETFLPWLGLAAPVVLVAALVRRSATALVALVPLTVAWLVPFGGALTAGDVPGHDLTVVQHNVSDENRDPEGTARTLMEAAPQLIALQELTPAALPAYRAALASRYPHHAVHGTVGLWSAYPLRDVRPLDIRPPGFGTDWNRGLRATAVTPSGEAAVLVAHLPSVRLGLSTGLGSAARDRSAAMLGRAIAAEPLGTVILLGDLNGTVQDRGLAPVTGALRPAPEDFALSWPAAFPLARIDQVMARSATVVDIRPLPRTGSDHLPVAARLRM